MHRHHLQPRRELFMAGFESGARTSELQPLPLTRSIPIRRQRDEAPFEDHWETGGIRIYTIVYKLVTIWLEKGFTAFPFFI